MIQPTYSWRERQISLDVPTFATLDPLGRDTQLYGSAALDRETWGAVGGGEPLLWSASLQLVRREDLLF